MVAANPGLREAAGHRSATVRASEFNGFQQIGTGKFELGSTCRER